MLNLVAMFGFWKKSVVVVLAVLILNLGGVYGQGQVYTAPVNYSNKSTFVSSNTPTTPSGGTGNYLSIGRFAMPVFPSGTTYYTNRSLVQFDLSSIPSNAIIITAHLKLNHYMGSGTPQLVTSRVKATWAESSVTWNGQPAYETTDEITSTPPASGIYTINVKDHVQKMVTGVYTNDGWIIRAGGLTESISASINRTYYSDHYSITTSRPRIEISYYIPMSVESASITHANASAPTETSGSISPVLINGPGGTYTYQWYNSSGVMSGKTSLNLSGVPYGWYGLKVTSSVAGTEPFFYAFLVGVNCQEVPIEFNPGPNYIDDAVLKFKLSTNNHWTNYSNSVLLDMSNQEFVVSKSVMKFNLWVDQTLTLGKADLTLMAQSVQYSSTVPDNSGTMHLISQGWNESLVTYSNQPPYLLTNSVHIPLLHTAPQLCLFDISSSFEFWKQDNTKNYGWMMSANSQNFSVKGQSFDSSDALSNRPKINFTVSLYDSECMSHTELKRKLDGGYSYAITGKLKFTLDEEYETSGNYLSFKIYDKNHLVIESSDMDGTILNGSVTPLPLKFDDNRWTLDISAIPGITKGEYYILETSNNKGDKRYLRFFYKN